MKSGASPRAVLVGVLALLAVVVLPAAYFVAAGDRPETVEGSVIGVKTRPPLLVDSFELLVADGRRLTFTIGSLDMSPGGFDPPHLVTHQASGQPVVVAFRRQGDALVAVRLADGPAAPVPTG